MNTKGKIILLLIGLSIFSYLIYDFGIDNLILNLTKAGSYFVYIIGVWGVVYVLNGFGWKFIIDSEEISFSEILSLTVSGFALNYITPSIAIGGEPYRIMELKSKLGTDKAVSSTLLYSMIHTLSSFVFWIIGIILALVFIDLKIQFKAGLFVLLLIFSLISIFIISRHKKGFIESILKIISKLPLLKNIRLKLQNKEDSLLEIDSQIRELYHSRRKDFYYSLFFEVLARIICSLENMLILRAIGIEIGFIEAIYISTVSYFVINLFFFMPLELGSREGGLVLVLETLSLSSSMGIFVGLVNRIRELFWILVGLLLIGIKGKRFNPFKAGGKVG